MGTKQVLGTFWVRAVGTDPKPRTWQELGSVPASLLHADFLGWPWAWAAGLRGTAVPQQSWLLPFSLHRVAMPAFSCTAHSTTAAACGAPWGRGTTCLTPGTPSHAQPAASCWEVFNQAY